MIEQTKYTSAKARALRFNADRVRKVAEKIENFVVTGFRIELLEQFCVNELQEWFLDNEVQKNQHKMYGLFDDRDTKMYFHGLAFEFSDDTTAMIFKLRFS
jgi:hypothetical protein